MKWRRDPPPITIPSTDHLQRCEIGAGIWMLLPIDIHPDEKEKRVAGFLEKANKAPITFNPNSKTI